MGRSGEEERNAGEGERERTDSLGCGRWREQDEKCNYDFEKWARPPSRKRERERMDTLSMIGSSLKRRLEFLD